MHEGQSAWLPSVVLRHRKLVVAVVLSLFALITKRGVYFAHRLAERQGTKVGRAASHAYLHEASFEEVLLSRGSRLKG